jgi:hypothetical protein
MAGSEKLWARVRFSAESDFRTSVWVRVRRNGRVQKALPIRAHCSIVTVLRAASVMQWRYCDVVSCCGQPFSTAAAAVAPPQLSRLRRQRPKAVFHEYGGLSGDVVLVLDDLEALRPFWLAIFWRNFHELLLSTIWSSRLKEKKIETYTTEITKCFLWARYHLLYGVKQLKISCKVCTAAQFSTAPLL